MNGRKKLSLTIFLALIQYTLNWITCTFTAFFLEFYHKQRKFIREQIKEKEQKHDLKKIKNWTLKWNKNTNTMFFINCLIFILLSKISDAFFGSWNDAIYFDFEKTLVFNSVTNFDIFLCSATQFQFIYLDFQMKIKNNQPICWY